MNPQETLYVNELSRKLQLDKRNLVKKLREMEEEGILKSEKRGNLKFYSINKNYALYEEFRKIVLKTTGLEHKLKEVLQKVKGVKKAYIYGSYAKDAMSVHSDIDILIVGNHNIVSLQRELNKLQRDLDREINSVSMDERELEKRLGNKAPFVTEIFKDKLIEIAL